MQELALQVDIAFSYAPGKVILVGEHAVVYGATAIAMPIDAGDLATTAFGLSVVLTFMSLGWSAHLATIFGAAPSAWIATRLFDTGAI